MNQDVATRAFTALGHPTRLDIFRLLVRAGPGGVPATEIARGLETPPSTLSGHLAVLKSAGLVTATRRHREILYAPRLEAVNALVTFLLSDCCAGDPSACAGLLPLVPDTLEA